MFSQFEDATCICQSDPCQNNSTCEAIIGSDFAYYCHCQDGYAGKHCDASMRQHTFLIQTNRIH